MNKYVYFLSLLALHISINAQIPSGVTGKTNIYFVRHAEKESGNDPVLTANGKKRAGELMRSIKDKNIKRIYVTQFKRTQMTADSMRLQLGIDTVHYVADDSGQDLFNQIAAHHDFKNSILVIGHSNTIPVCIKKMGVENFPAVNIPDAEFDNIYKVYYRRPFLFLHLKAHVKKGKYGSASAVSATMK
jgi:phosphohistidine phosphatase SixA